MQLLELVKGEHTSESVYNKMATFGEFVLGKGIVLPKILPTSLEIV